VPFGEKNKKLSGELKQYFEKGKKLEQIIKENSKTINKKNG
jgi:hypothetical protein